MIASSTCGQMLPRGCSSSLGAIGRPLPSSRGGAGILVMSSTGTSTSSASRVGGLGRHDRRPRAEPARNRATSSCGRTVALSPMRRAGDVEQRVEPLERHRQVGAALGAGDGVDLVDDDGVDACAGSRAPPT